jgi:heavy metal sensor kinase
MIFKSIKWRLQLWYGVILVAVLAGFGVMAYQLERGRLWRQVDEDLHRRFAVLTSALHQAHGPENRHRNGHRPEPPPDGMPDDFPPPQDLPLEHFTLPPFAAGWFDTNQPNGFYYLILSPTGTRLAASPNAPAAPRGEVPPARNAPGQEPNNPRPPAPAWTQDGFREIANHTPSDETVVVGCAIEPQRRELKLTAVNLTVMGGLVLLVGLAGGWWLVGRALRPIAEISSTATKISAGDLSQRINTAEAESELGQLAAVLNSTFARLETAFAQQQQFAADAAHELRTPVSVLLTQTQTALTREREAASYRQTVEACQRAAQRMRKLIESLLELARFDAGQEILSRQPFDLARAAAECVELIRPLAEERRVKISTELAPLEITGDAGRLAQVITNLLTNAVQFNQPEGEVRLRLEARDGLAVLEVADTGRGIAPADLPHVFERFYRADPARTGAGNSGLGLSICKAIVEAHGGSIEAANGSGSGAGATFTLRLPVRN